MVDAGHVERVHLVVQARRRGRALQDLSRLRRLTIVNVGRVELVVVEEARRAALAAQLLTLRATPLARVVLLAVRQIGQRHLFGGLRHPEELLRARRVGRVAMALHETHQVLRVAVDSGGIVRCARVCLGGQRVSLCEEVLQRLLRPANGRRLHGRANRPGRENVVDRRLRGADARVIVRVIVAVVLIRFRRCNDTLLLQFLEGRGLGKPIHGRLGCLATRLNARPHPRPL